MTDRTDSHPQAADEPSPRRRSYGGLLKLLIVLAAVGALVGVSYVLPLTEWFIDALEWAEGLGVWTGVFVAGVYVVACVLLLPGSILTLGAGALLGVVYGTVTVSIGSTIGACAAFLVGRFVARNWVERKVSSNPKFTAVDAAVGRQGFKIVLLLRLSPVFPFNLLNYGCGLTKVSFWKYALASWVGMLPGTVMYVYVGSTIGEVAKLAAGGRQKSTAEWIFYGVGLAVTLLVTVLVTRIARKALKESVELQTPPPEGEPNHAG